MLPAQTDQHITHAGVLASAFGARFGACAPHLLAAEGYWSDDAADRGGATKYGISLRYLRGVADHDGDGRADGDLDGDGDVDADDVRRLTLADALALYHRDFWLASGCDRLPVGIDRAVFCGAVNHGVAQAVRFLQRALGVRADGVVGPHTAGAAARKDGRWLLADMLSRRAQFYADIVAADASQARFLRGWLRRLFETQAAALADLT